MSSNENLNFTDNREDNREKVIKLEIPEEIKNEMEDKIQDKNLSYVLDVLKNNKFDIRDSQYFLDLDNKLSQAACCLTYRNTIEKTIRMTA